MINPGTWLKHYCTDLRTRPIYFYYVGRLLTDVPSEELMHIVIASWGLRMEVNQDFIDWLEPLDAADKPPSRMPDWNQKQVNKPNLPGRGGSGAKATVKAAEPVWQTTGPMINAAWPRLMRQR